MDVIIQGILSGVITGALALALWRLFIELL